MNRRTCRVVICVVCLMVVTGCSKRGSASKLVVEVPSGFTGNFLLEMGVKEAPPLEKRGDAFVVAVPRSGKLLTSTLLTNPKPTFQNSSDGGIWGYSHLIFTTGDGIPTGGKIEFFVGTRKEYEAEQGRKNHSEGFAVTPVASTA